MTVKDNGDIIKDSYVTFELPVKSKLKIDKEKNFNSSGKINEDPILYHQNPIFLIWGSLICIMIAIAAGSFPVFVSQLFELKKEFNLNAKEFLSSVVYAIMLTLFLVFSNSGGDLLGYYKPDEVINHFHILFKNGNILSGIVLSTIVMLLPCFAVVFMVALSSDNILKREHINFDSIRKSVKKIDILSKTLQGALQVLAVIVVFSVLTSNALGESIRQMIEIDSFEIFPKEISYSYGMYFSLFLCIIYIPVYYYIKQNYLILKEIAADLEEKEIVKGTYNALFGVTKFESSPLDNLKLAFTILAPLLSSFLPKGLLMS
jgi:hypothetical protein